MMDSALARMLSVIEAFGKIRSPASISRRIA
jgi:hypothetical protein